jgi:hypothetical protein
MTTTGMSETRRRAKSGVREKALLSFVSTVAAARRYAEGGPRVTLSSPGTEAECRRGDCSTMRQAITAPPPLCSRSMIHGSLQMMSAARLSRGPARPGSRSRRAAR